MSEERKWTAKGKYVFDGNDCIGIFDTDNASEKEMENNATMAAAAPELYDALVAVLDAVCYIRGIDIDFYARDEIKVARKALAKARGEK